MGAFYHIGRIFLCLALTFQGFYILGLIPGQSNKALTNSMERGVNNFAGLAHLPADLAKEIRTNVPYVAKAIGGLLSLAFLNIFGSSRFLIKLNILGIFLLTLFIGIPYNVIKGGNPLDPADKTLFHFYSNLAVLGGLIYYHSATSSGVRAEKQKRD